MDCFPPYRLPTTAPTAFYRTEEAHFRVDRCSGTARVVSACRNGQTSGGRPALRPPSSVSPTGYQPLPKALGAAGRGASAARQAVGCSVGSRAAGVGPYSPRPVAGRGGARALSHPCGGEALPSGWTGEAGQGGATAAGGGTPTAGARSGARRSGRSCRACTSGRRPSRGRSSRPSSTRR